MNSLPLHGILSAEWLPWTTEPMRSISERNASVRGLQPEILWKTLLPCADMPISLR